MSRFGFNFAGAGAVVADSVTTTGTVTADKFRASASKSNTDVAYGYAGLDTYGHYYGAGKVITTINQSNLLEAAGTVVDTNTAVGFMTQGFLRFDGKIAVNLTGTQTDWAPSGGDTRGMWQVTPDAARTINSIASLASQGSGGTVILANLSSTAGRNITLLHDDGATGTAAYRFLCPNNTSLVVPPNGAALLQYDTSLSRIRAYPLY